MSAKLLVLLFCAGCAEYDLAAETNDAVDSGALDEGDDVTEVFVRVDVYPPASLGADGPPEQSVAFDAVNGQLSISLEDGIVVAGALTGFDAAPYASVSVPGQTAPVVGHVSASLPDSIVARKLATDADGMFSGLLVSGEGYTVAWIPESPVELPFVIARDVSLTGDSDLSMELDFGVPLYGRITHEGTVPLAGVAVQAVDPETGIGGPVVTSGDDGRYMLRVLPGDYDLRLSGPDLRILPNKTVSVYVPEDTGLRQDVEYGSLRTVPIRGSVLDADGDPAENVLIRLTALSLDGVPDASLVIELDTPTNGIFADDILPGSYSVEYIPPYQPEGDGPGMGPALLPDPLVVAGPSTQIASVTLPARVTVTAKVVDPNGEAVARALVRAQENSFGNYVFEAISDDEGMVEIEVSDVDLTWSIQPPAGADGAVTFFAASPDELGDALQLSAGRVVEGVIGWRGDAVPFAAVEIRDGLGRLYGSALTDESGEFSLRVDLTAPR